jgi:CBS-domain-containing membrane protein
MEDTAAAPAAEAAPRMRLPAWNAWRASLISGLGGFAAILCLAEASALGRATLLIAPFGASCVLAFALPASPVAQPRNIIGGHLIATIVGLATYALMGATPVSFAIGVGVAIALMQISGSLHPPAGADPIVVILAKASWPFLFAPVLVGAVAIVVIAIGYHRWLSKRGYPVNL